MTQPSACLKSDVVHGAEKVILIVFCRNEPKHGADTIVIKEKYWRKAFFFFKLDLR